MGVLFLRRTLPLADMWAVSKVVALAILQRSLMERARTHNNLYAILFGSTSHDCNFSHCPDVMET